VRLLRKSNGGKSTALNLGLSEATGDWVWLFDDDDVALPDALERMLEVLDRSPWADFAYSGQIVARDGSDGKLEALFETPVPGVSADELFLHTLKCFPFRMQGLLMRRQKVQEAGAFDAAYVRSQDYEFYTRFLQIARGVPLERPTFFWRVHDGLRGPGHAVHAGEQRDEVWRRYDARFALALRDTLPLGRYLVPAKLDGVLNGRDRQLALIQRALVMASKGLTKEMAADLRSADGIDKDPSAPSLPRWLGNQVADAANFASFREQVMTHPEALLNAMHSAGRGKLARDTFRHLARGLWWTLRNTPYPWRARRTILHVMLRLLVRSLR
jgi:hypothetical protein